MTHGGLVQRKPVLTSNSTMAEPTFGHLKLSSRFNWNNAISQDFSVPYFSRNLATKEDIEEITRKTEDVQRAFRERFELFSSDVHFKYDFFYEQYSKLYCNLYAIVMQSEYVRSFLFLNNKQTIPFDEAPFLEVSPQKRITQHTTWGLEQPTRMEQKIEELETPLSQYNKKKLCEYIIKNGEFASQKLLKIAIAYRFAYSYYDGNRDAKHSDLSETANAEEFRLIRELVCCIVTEYNALRRDLKMDYNAEELNTGIPTL